MNVLHIINIFKNVPEFKYLKQNNVNEVKDKFEEKQ